MSRTNVHESGIVINTAEESDTFDSIFVYISQHINSWTKSNVLWDLSCFDFNTIDTKSICKFIHKGAYLSEKRLDLKTAIIANSDLGFGMMRMFQMMAEGTFKFEIDVFRSSAQAIAWLSK